MKITAEQLDTLGKISDTADNFHSASKMRLPPTVHAEQLTLGMLDIRDSLRKLYQELSGENPWVDSDA